MIKNKCMGGYACCIFMLTIAMLSGCSAPDNAEDPGLVENEQQTEERTQENEAEDITLIWAVDRASRFEQEKEDIEVQFPNITIEFFEVASTRESLEEMLIAQVYPDIISTHNAYRVPFYMETGLAYDMDELIDTLNYDASHLDQTLLKRVRSYAPNQELYMFTYYPDVLALYYNKDIFDLFGVEYPVDGMTWEEVLSLARSLTREESNQQYKGLNIWNPFFAGEAYDVNYVDPDTHEPIFAQSEGVNKGFGLYMEMRQIPGNIPSEGWAGSFLGDRDLAMLGLYPEIRRFLSEEEETGFNWDMVSWPVFEDGPDVNPVQGGTAFGVAETSQHKRESFEVLTYLLTEEYQIGRVREGHSTPLEADDIKQQIYAGVPEMEDKNAAALYYNEYNAGPERRSTYDNVLDEFRPDIIEYLTEGERDLGEILMELEERAAEFIEDQQSRIEN